nr:integrase, catalytic region, zinc finger, CCHC-type, peptidase aspartic, catalytic [Tanacetum cinerariifolium]
MNMSPENKAHFEAEKEAIHLILTRIKDEIYSTVDACQAAQEVWEAIERLQQGESLNIQDAVATMQVNVQFLQQLQPEWSRFVTIVKQQHKLDEVSYHKLFNILKQYQKEVNDLRAERLARNANPLALWYKNDNHSGQFRNQRTMNVARAREKECRKPKRVKDSAYHKEKMLLCKQAEQGVPLQAEQYDWLAETNEEVDEYELEAHYSYVAKIQEVHTAETGTDSEPLEKNEQNDVESDDERIALANLIANLKLDVDENKKIQKQLKKANTTLAQELKECKAILAETSKSLGESISVRDSCLVAIQNKQTEFEKYKAFNDRSIDYDKLERKLNETLGQLAQKYIEIKEGLKTKAYEISVFKEKHEELIKQSLLTKSHYEGLVKQKTKVITDLKLREEHDIDKMLSMKKPLKFLNEIVYKRSQSIQTIHMMEPKVPICNGRPTFANPKYLKQAQSEIPCLYAFPCDQSTHANRLILDGEETLALERENVLDELQRLYLVKECDCIAQKLSNQTDSVSKEVHSELLKRFAKVEKHSISLKIALQKRKEQKLIEKGKGKSVDTKFDKPSVVRQPNAQRIPKPSVLEGLSKPITAQTLPQTARQAVSNINMLKPGMYRIDNRPHHKRNQLKDKVLPNNSQVKLKKTQVQVHPRIPSVSNKMKYVTACKDSLNSRTLNANAVCATCNKCLVDSNHFACVTKMLNDVHARTKKPNFTPILCYGDLVPGNVMINRVYYVEGLNHNLFLVGQFCDADLEVAFRKSTCFVRDLKGNDLLIGNRGSDLYKISLQESTSSTPLCLMAKASTTQAWLWHRRLSHLDFDYINLLSKKDIVIGLPKLKYVKDQLCSFCKLSKAKRSSFKSKVVPSSKGRLNLLHMNLCGPMRVASINGKKYILMKEKGDPCILVGYSTQSKGYRVYNKRKRMIVESIHIRFDEIKEASETSVANDTFRTRSSMIKGVRL